MGKTSTWISNTTNQYFPTIIKSLLGNGFALVSSQAFFGDGSDGNVTISSGITILTRDMFYNNLTISGTGQISVQNQRIFVLGTLDLSTAPVFAIDGSGNNGGNGGNGGAAGGAGATVAVGTNITGRAGSAGGAGGSVAAGAQGGAGSGGNSITGQTGGASGAGGAGASTAGGALRAAPSVTDFPMRDITTWFLPQTGSGAQIFVGGSGPGGGGGGGDLINSGGGGGGGGSSGQTVYISAKIIKTGSGSLASTITSWGGAGGNGGSPTVGNTGGGGGGGGGSGGWIVIKYNTKIGTPIANFISAFGGFTNALGGTAHGTGINGSNGSAGQSGLIQLLDLSTGAITSNLTGSVNF